MSEGLLKEKIMALVNSPRSIDDEDIQDILDEAGEEFLGFVYDIHDPFVLDWFRKYFGTDFYASMPKVVGGCAGHINLNKLKDIENQV